jgi:5'-nucleotidase
VQPGASLIVTNGLIAGPVTATRPALFTLSGTQLVGPLSVTGATGPVLLDKAKITGPVSLSGNKAGVKIDTAKITGPVSVVNNTGGAAVVAGNAITGPLACSGNNPAPGNDGRKNTVHGPASGQCTTL